MRTIRLGAYVDTDTLGEWELWGKAQGKRPYYYADWLNPRHALSAGPINYEGFNVLALQKLSGSPGLFLNFNLFPEAGETMADVLADSVTTSGMVAKEYVATLAEKLLAYTDATKLAVPIRFLHEMTNHDKPWQSIDPTTYKALFRQWAGILHFFNPRLKTVWCVGGGGSPDFEQYYPGDKAVDWVGCDIYPGMSPRPTEREFTQLNAVYDLARRHSKPFCIPEFSRPRGTIQEVADDPQYLKRLGEWMVDHPRLAAVVNFEVLNHNGDWRLSDGIHKRMLETWRSYATRPTFS
jgi:hypothetical protein